MLNGPDKPVQGSDDLTGMSPLLFSEKGQDAPAAPQGDALTQDAEDLTGMSGLIFGEADAGQEQPAASPAPLALPPALEEELQLRNLHSAFSGVSPDKLGQAADMAAKAGVPLAVAAQDPEKFRRAMEGNPDWQALLSEAPATVDFLRDGPNMGVAGDSIPQLGEVERLHAALAGYAGRRPEPLPGMADVLSGWAKTGDSPGVFRGFLGGVTETLKGIARGNNILAANFAERRMRGVEDDLRAVGYADADVRAYLDDGRPLPQMPNEAALPWYWRISNDRPEQEGTRTPDQAAWLNSAPLMRAWYGLWRNVSESNRDGWLSAANADSKWGRLFRADQDFAANLQRYGGLPRLSFDLGNGVASMANSMAWAMFGSPMAGVAAMYAQIAGGDLERGEAEGLDRDKNWRWANWNALLQSPMEALSLGKALAVWKPGKLLGQRFKALAESMLTEGITEYAQSYVEELADLYRHSDKESLAEMQTFLARVSTARFQADAGYQGAVGALSSALVGGPRVATAMWTRNPQGQDQITNLAQAVEQVQALKRSAVVAEAFTAQLVEKGRLPGKVFVPAQALQTYFQADPSSARLEGFLATAGLDMNAYLAALGTGADLEIEGRKLGPVFQTEAGKALRDAFTMNPVEREAADMVSQIVQEVDAGGSIEQAAASAAERMQAEELFKAPIAEPSQYREQVVRSMVGAGLAENRARKVADLIDANARIWATIPGESVQSYYERYGFRFRKTAFGRIMQQMFLDHGAGLGVPTFEQMVARYNTSPRFREKVHRMVPRYLEAEVQAEAPALDLAGVESVVREAARALNLDPAAAWTQVQGLVGGLDVPSIVDAVRGVAGDALAGEVQKVFTGRDQAAEKRRVLDIERWAREQAAVQRDASLESYNAVVGRIRELGGLNSQDIMRDHGKGALETLQSTLGRDIVSRNGKHPDELAGEFQELAGHLGTFADNGLADGQALVEWLLNARSKKAILERYRRDVEALKAEAEGLSLAAQERLPLAEPEVDEVPFQRQRQVLMQSAFHGSPHRFNRFDLSKIGTGEGAQAYGWGLYFAGAREVAEHYRDLARRFVTYKGKLYDLGEFMQDRTVPNSPSEFVLHEVIRNYGYRFSSSKGDMQKSIDLVLDGLRLDQSSDFWRKALEFGEKLRAEDLTTQEGQLYKVEIPDDSDLLDWDKPLSEQSEKVRGAYLQIRTTFPGLASMLKFAEKRAAPVSDKQLMARGTRLLNSDEMVSAFNSDIGAREILTRLALAHEEGAETFRAAVMSEDTPGHMRRKLLGKEYEMLGKDLYRALQFKASKSRDGGKAASEYLRSIGIPGHRYLDGDSRAKGEGSYNYVIYDDEAVQVLETFYQDSLGFYSPVARAVGGMEFKTIPAGDLVNRIKKLPGVKQEELDDLGLLDWLGGLKGQKVTKEHVLDFIQAGGPKLEEVVLGEAMPRLSDLDFSMFRPAPAEDVKQTLEALKKTPFAVIERDGKFFVDSGEGPDNYRYSAADSREGAEERAYWYSRGYLRAGRGGDQIIIPDLPNGFFVGKATAEDAARLADGVTRAGDWTLYLGADRSESYTPLMTFPNETGTFAEAVAQGRSAVESIPGLEKFSGEWDAARSQLEPKYEQYSLPGGENYREVLLRLPGPGVKHGHWPKTDVLAHLRLKEFRDADGRRILLVDEVQSDWHQEGRKKGYDAVGEVRREKTPGGQYLWRVWFPDGQHEFAYTSEAEAQKHIHDRPGVPNAPFKKTWALLAFKRAMRLAAEEGFDSVAWTPGEVQADRYDLSRYIREIRYAKEGDSYFLRAWDQADGNTVLDEVVPSDKLDDFVGKDVAEKIRRGEGEEAPGSFFKGNTVRDATLLSGLDLKTGGEGMRGFYDKMLPKMIGEYVRKLDKEARVGTVSIGGDEPGGNRWRIFNPDMLVLREGTDPAELDRAVQELETKYGPDSMGEDFMVEEGVKGSGKQEVWNLPLTDTLRAAVLAGQPLYQGKQAPIGPRGATQFAQDGQAMIHFFEARNLSTAPHEVYHVFRKVLEDMAGHPNAPQWVKDDWSRACEFVGAEVGQRWTPEQEEKWARAGEAYLREGQAPAPGLRGVFTTFRRWMRNIYETVLQLGVNLSPDMRGVFDRLLATDEEIAQARERVDARPMLDLEQAAAEYVEAARKAQVVADEAIEKRRLEEHARRLPAWTKQAREDVEKHPGQRLLSDIIAGGGLNLEALLNELPLDERTLSRIRSLRPGTNLAHEGGSVDARSLADAHGFETVGEMVAELLDTPTKSELLKARVSELEEEFNADWDPEVAILSDEYERLAEMEAEVLAESTNGRPARAFEIKRIVRERTGQMRTEYIQVSEMEALKSVIRREAAAARTAYRAGKNDMALAAKERQRRAIAELRERFKAKQEIARIIAKAKRAAKSKSISWGFHEQVLELVRRFGLGTDTMVPRRPDERPALADFLVSHGDLFGPAGSSPDLAEWIVQSDGQDANYRDLTLEQLRDVAEAVDVLAHQGRDYDKLIAGQEKAAIKDVAERSAQVMADLKDRPGLSEVQRKSLLGKPREYIRRQLAELGIVEWMLKAADGFRKGTEAMAGPLYKHLMRPIIEAREAELRTWEDLGRRLDAILAPMASWSRERFAIPGVTLPGDVVRDWEGTWTREKVFMLALNMGNSGNRKALRRGYGQVVNGEFQELPDEALDRIVSVLTDAEWDMVEQVWELVDSVFPAVDDAHFRLVGKKLKKVQAEPFYTPGGRLMRGGYFPLVFDRRFSRKAAKQIEAEELLNSRNAVLQNPKAKDGFTNERQGGTLPPRLSLSVLHRHLYDSVHYATHAVAMRDASRLVQHDAFADAFTAKFGPEAYEQLMPWLRYIARPERERGDAFDDFVSRLRNKASLAVLGLNPRVILTQFTALANAVPEVGLARVLKGLGHLAAHRGQAVEMVRERSVLMRSRSQNLDREMKQVLDKYDPDVRSWNVLGKRITLQDFHEFCFKGIQMADMAVAYPVWLAGYNKGLAQGLDEEAARKYADDVMRQTQAVAHPFSLSGFQRNPNGVKQLFSMFMTFTANFYGRQTYFLRGLREGKVSAGEFASHFWWEWMMPPLLAELAVSLLAGGGLPWDDKEEAKNLSMEVLGSWVAGIPVVRNLAGALRYSRDVSDTPALQGLDAVARMLKTSVAIPMDLMAGNPVRNEDYLRWLRHTTEALSFTLGIPVKWAPVAWKGIEDWHKGRTENPFRLLFKDPNEKR